MQGYGAVSLAAPTWLRSAPVPPGTGSVPDSVPTSLVVESGCPHGPQVVVGFRAETNGFKAKPLIFVVVEQHWIEERTALTGVTTRLVRPGWHRQGKTTENIL